MQTDLLLISMKAHQAYVTSRMASKLHQKYYTDIYFVALQIIRSTPNYKTALAAIDATLSSLSDNKYWPNTELKYKKLAIKHINDIVLSISNRFK
ncbi:MAG: hypothetical protein HC836_46620 [Richelia sp. RM2_1_2]|nr:hypothetical protein [Richelia sp. RM2_1_2]